MVIRFSSPIWDRQMGFGCAAHVSTPAPNCTTATTSGSATRNSCWTPASRFRSVKDPVSAVPHSERAQVLQRSTATSRKDYAYEDSAAQHRGKNRRRRPQPQPDDRNQCGAARLLVHLSGAVVDLPLGDLRLPV